MTATSRLQRLYDRSPVFLQDAMTTIKGYANNRKRYGTTYRQHRRWLEDFDTWSYAAKLEHQQQALTAFVTHAYRHSAFYKALFDAHDLHPEDIRSAADLVRLPTVTKEDLRANMHAIRAHLPTDRISESHTGGTTGKSLVVTVTYEDIERRMAMLDHFKSRVGFENRKMRRASFTGKHMLAPSQSNPPFSRRNVAANQMLFSSFHLSERTAGSYFEEMNRFRPDAIDGFPSGMLGLARFMLANDLHLDVIPTAIFPTAETLTAPDREVLETAFGARVYDQYASSEGAPFITECRAGKLHVEMSTGVFEHTSDDHLLVTSYLTHATPLIRYDIRDRAIRSPATSCTCGVDSDMVEELAGRTSEFLYRSDGTKVFSANLSNLFKNVPNSIIEAQLQQHRPGLVEILIVRDLDSHRPEHDDILRDEFRHKFDGQSEIRIDHVDAISPEASGKRPFLKNSVQDRDMP